MFFSRHDQVSVSRFAVHHARDARPANALFARDRYFNAVRGKDLDHRFVWWYEESLAGAGELDFEALVLGARGRRGRKIFSVNAATAPTELIGGANQFGWSSSCVRSEEHTSELQSLMRISYAVFCLKKKHVHL